MEKVFAFLDSDRGVLQTVQQIVLRDFANSQDLEITFVGAEIVGSETHHRLLEWYINNRIHNNLMFFSLSQFQKGKQYDLALVNAAIDNGIGIYFATERVVLKDVEELDKMKTHLAILSIIRNQQY